MRRRRIVLDQVFSGRRRLGVGVVSTVAPDDDDRAGLPEVGQP
jgi:hypothetical protein